VRFDDAVHKVVGLDAAVTILMSEAGRHVVMEVDALLCDPTFEMIDSRPSLSSSSEVPAH
jgi:hypothetical protein